MSSQVSNPPEGPGSTRIYVPVNPDKHEIRLLKLARGELKDPISCSLIHASLDGHPPYEALSYAWGCKNQSCKIFIDDQDFHVTQNLKAALTRLRSKKEDRLLWVDAICINQDDIPERNTQVAQMQTVYKNARNVRIWLGEEENQSDLAIQLLMELKDRGMSRQWIRDSLTSGFYQDWYIALLNMLLRPYWQRLWVVQEVAFAGNAVIHCGKSSIPYEIALEFTKVFDKVCEQLIEHERNLNMVMIRSQYLIAGPNVLPEPGKARTSTRASLLDVMIGYAEKGASDPRDKVYGLIGVSNINNNLKRNLPIDYGLPVSEVYRRLVQVVVKETNRIDILSCCMRNNPSLHNPETLQADLPSWTPDWRHKPQIETLSHLLDSISADGLKHADAVFSKDGTTLTVKGFCVGLINFCGPTFQSHAKIHEEEKMNQSFGELVLCILQWRSVILNSPMNEEGQDTFYRMLAMNMTINLDNFKIWWKEWEENLRQRQSAQISREQISVLSSIRALLRGRFMFMSFKTTTDVQLSTTEFVSNTKPFLKGLIGLAPEAARENDLICVLLGCRCPVILRRTDDHFILIGEVWVNGYMYGEVLEEAAKGVYKLQEFSLH